ncbi:MAG: class I SAM-dependent methyltransferase [Candidatus Hydrothermarchaeales archaeon]
MTENKLSMEEIENLSYYDFMSYLGASFFQIGGPKSTERLAEQCQINKDKKVLEVGCGTGFNACLIAKKFGCRVVGVDIAEVSIEKAKERAEKEGLTDRAEFRTGNAYDLPFEDNSFDVAITTFVSQFLDMERAFKEFVRVLKPGGYVGINEMYKDRDIPQKPAEEIQHVEDILNDLTELPFKLHTPEDWKKLFKDAGLADIQINKSREFMGIRDTPQIITEMGGWVQLSKVMVRMIKYSLLSKEIRSRFKRLQKTKAVFLRKKSTSKHVGYVLGTGKKA